jgi:menaquinol-cytochrome c reductase iron-sulfur subunit
MSAPKPPYGLDQGLSRRGFYVGAIYAMGAAIMAALGLPALAYLLLPPKLHQGDKWVDAGDISRFSPDVPVEITFRHNRVDGWKVTSEKTTAWVVKRDDDSPVAFGPQCTHLGCAYHWDESKSEFLCPCHNSLFSIDGQVISGPAPRPLDRYQTKVEGSKLWLGPLHSPEKKA